MIELDTQRTIVKEPAERLVRLAKDLEVPDDPRGRIWQWGTGSITLKPINVVPEFSSTDRYEALKFRLADCIYNPDAMIEVPHYHVRNHQTGGVDAWDRFFVGQVKAPYLGDPGTPSGLIPTILAIAIEAIDHAILTQYTEEVRNKISLIRSRKAQPANQGYCLRFRVDGFGDSALSGILTFYFGQYAIQLDGDGTGRLYQTVSSAGWGVATFRWAEKGQISGFDHEILIYPHAREYIEVVCSRPITRHWTVNLKGYYTVMPVERSGPGLAFDVGLLYHVPFETRRPDGSYEITTESPWALQFTRDYLPEVQVSRLGFYDGTAVPAKVTEGYQSFGYAPTMPLHWSVSADLNGGSANMSLVTATDVLGLLLDPAHIVAYPWASDGKNDEFAPVIFLQGRGDIPGNGVASMSSTSPELYGYTVYKDAHLELDHDALPRSFPVKSVSIDSGSSPENEVLQVVVDNSLGGVDEFRYRTYMPCRLYDVSSGNTLFEGFAYEVDSIEHPSMQPRELRIMARGMADAMLQAHPVALDFTEDPSNPGSAYSWQSALRTCAQSAGFQETQVVFDGTGRDDEGPNKPYRLPGKAYDFPLWREGGSGGASTGGVKASTGTGGQRWRPNPLVPIYQFYDHLVREIMGWHWGWDKVQRVWRHWKRPKPDELGFADAKCAFFGNRAALVAWRAARQENAAVPCYLHSSYHQTTKKPQATTIDAYGCFPVRVVHAKEQMDQILTKGVQPDLIAQPSIAYETRVTAFRFDNPRGYAKEGHPAPDRAHSDYMGRQIVRPIPLLQAATEEAFRWLGRRIFEDLAFGYTMAEFESDWGDFATHNLRKWDLVLIDPNPADPKSGWYLIDRIEASWTHDTMRRARYTASKYRADAHPPR